MTVQEFVKHHGAGIPARLIEGNASARRCESVLSLGVEIKKAIKNDVPVEFGTDNIVKINDGNFPYGRTYEILH